ncbi:Uncharacterised protein [Mycobacterium tuberculosis]|nr:Uncharacterised protein [Mycobacterium tuberculosis]
MRTTPPTRNPGSPTEARPPPRIRGAVMRGASGTALSNDCATTCGTRPCSRSAHTTAGSARSTTARRPP